MDQISSLFQRFLQSYQRKDVIFEGGKQGNEMFTIYRGRVRIVKKSTKGVCTLCSGVRSYAP